MNNLLYSKRFKRNLTKWIISYFIVIGLFATVVTYSRYISNYRSLDSARAAKFDATISYINKCEQQAEKTLCDNGEYRPTSLIPVEFKVDTTNMEVSSLFITSITINSDFTIDTIYVNDQVFTDYLVNQNRVTITDNLTPSTTYIRKYKVVLKYNAEEIDNKYQQPHNYKDMVSVGWSATQKD